MGTQLRTCGCLHQWLHLLEMECSRKQPQTAKHMVPADSVCRVIRCSVRWFHTFLFQCGADLFLNSVSECTAAARQSSAELEWVCYSSEIKTHARVLYETAANLSIHRLTVVQRHKHTWPQVLLKECSASLLVGEICLPELDCLGFVCPNIGKWVSTP